MPKHVDVPGVGIVEFPDGMGDSAISQAIQKQHPNLKPPIQTVPKMSGGGFLDHARNFLVSGDANKPYDKNTGGYGAVNSDNPVGNFITSPAQGGEDIQTGAHQMMSGEKLKGANKLFSGGAKIASAAIPGAMAAAPFKTALGLVGAGVGGVAGNVGTSLFSDDPDVQEMGGNIGSVVGGAGGFKHGADVPQKFLPEFVRGAANSAMDQVRPTLDKFSLWHPLKNIGTMYDAAKNTLEGGTRAVKSAQGDTSLPDPGEMPNAGKVKQNLLKFKRGEEGTVNNEEMNNAYRKVAPASVGSSSTSSQGPTSRPVLPSGRAVPGTVPDIKPKTPTPDIHDQIAMEGLQKRAADSRAKYEDVYQNVIKGQYTPEELRNLTPEQHTQIDMKIKGMKHPDEHPQAGKKKYGTGLNPAVIDSLANRLEQE